MSPHGDIIKVARHQEQCQPTLEMPPFGSASLLCERKQRTISVAVPGSFWLPMKCPILVNVPQPPRLWESGNPAGFAGFPSGVGKSVF